MKEKRKFVVDTFLINHDINSDTIFTNMTDEEKRKFAENDLSLVYANSDDSVIFEGAINKKINMNLKNIYKSEKLYFNLNGDIITEEELRKISSILIYNLVTKETDLLDNTKDVLNIVADNGISISVESYGPHHVIFENDRLGENIKYKFSTDIDSCECMLYIKHNNTRAVGICIACIINTHDLRLKQECMINDR